MHPAPRGAPDPHPNEKSSSLVHERRARTTAIANGPTGFVTGDAGGMPGDTCATRQGQPSARGDGGSGVEAAERWILSPEKPPTSLPRWPKQTRAKRHLPPRFHLGHAGLTTPGDGPRLLLEPLRSLLSREAHAAKSLQALIPQQLVQTPLVVFLTAENKLKTEVSSHCQEGSSPTRRVQRAPVHLYKVLTAFLLAPGLLQPLGRLSPPYQARVRQTR